MPFDSSEPFHFNAPKQFDAKKKNFEEISFKFKSYRSLMTPNFTMKMINIEQNLEIPMTDAIFEDDESETKTRSI